MASSRVEPLRLAALQFGTARHRSLCASFSIMTLALRGHTDQLLPRRELSPRVQVVEIQDRVEHQEVAALRLRPPERVIREHHDVPLSVRRIDHRRRAAPISTPPPGDPDTSSSGIRVPQHDARTRRRRDQVDGIPKLLVQSPTGGSQSSGLRLLRRLERRSALRQIGIVRGAAAGRRARSSPRPPRRRRRRPAGSSD